MGFPFLELSLWLFSPSLSLQQFPQYKVDCIIMRFMGLRVVVGVVGLGVGLGVGMGVELGGPGVTVGLDVEIKASHSQVPPSITSS